MSEVHPVMQLTRKANAAFAEREWELLADMHAESFQAEDRRAGFRLTYTKEENLAQMRVIAEVGITRISADLVEARGQHCAIIRATYEADSGFIVPVLAVIQIDEDGRTLRGVVFEEDQLEDARAQLELYAP